MTYSPPDKGGPIPVAFSYGGNLSTGTGTFRWYNDSGKTLTIVSERGSVGTAPTTQNVILDVNVSGSSIYNNVNGNSINISPGANTGQGGTKTITTIANGQYFTIDVVQTGTGTVGADLTVVIWLSD